MRAEQLWRDGAAVETSFTDTAVASEGLNATSARDQRAAQEQIRANAALEEAALARLSPEDQARYGRVAAMTEADPSARLSLQLLAMEDRLVAGPTAADRRNLLHALDAMATQPVAPGIDQPALVSDAVQEIAFPVGIDQHYRGTCTVTSAQILMAFENPAEYARLVGGLASPAGTVQMANGGTLRREAGTETVGELLARQQDGTRQRREELRTQSSRLFQPAMMECGNGAQDYDNRTDLSSGGGGAARPGLTPTEYDGVVDALTGRNHEYVFVDNDPARAQQALGRIQQATGAGQLVPTTVRWGDAGPMGEHPAHAVIVTQVHDGRVHFNNPWGQRDSMTVAEFASRLYPAEL